jgi:hypothetical protein
MLQIIQPGNYKAGLAYPAGRTAAFNQTHAASNGIVNGGQGDVIFCPNNGFISLVTGKPYANTNTTASPIISGIGPNLNIQTSGGRATSTFSSAALTALTVGVVVQFTSINVAATYQTLWTSGGSTAAFGLNASHVFNLFYSSDHASNITPIANTPYFAVASANQITTSNVNFVVVNLLTGQMFTSTTAACTNNPLNSGGANCGIGTVSANQAMNGSVSHCFWNPVYMSLQQLEQLAVDLWSIWYVA